MVALTVKIDLDDIIDEIDDMFKRQIPFAAQVALNETVFKASVKTKKAMPFFIEGGPTPFTARGVQYEKAKNKRDLRASIFIPEDQWKYMRWIVDGGTKQWSRSHFGIGKPIYKNTRFNKYGNIPGRRRKEKVWREMLQQSQGSTGKVEGDLKAKEFIGTVNGKPALWKRYGSKGKKLKLLMVFGGAAEYGKGRFPFHQFNTRYVEKHFNKAFGKRLVQIINKESKRIKAS